MKKISGLIAIIQTVAKYGAIVVAIVKGIEVVVSELKNIDLDD